MKIVVILIILAIIFFYYSEFNQKNRNGFSVHYTDPGDSAAMFAEIDRRIEILKKYMLKKYSCKSCGIINKFNMNERVGQLFTNYKKGNFREISPHNLLSSTSFTEGKGKRIVMCLRGKDDKIQDVNTIMFVSLHEITHVMNDEWGHPLGFWQLFRIVLGDARDCGIYDPIDYSKHPQSYCGIIIDQSPLYV